MVPPLRRLPLFIASWGPPWGPHEDYRMLAQDDISAGIMKTRTCQPRKVVSQVVIRTDYLPRIRRFRESIREATAKVSRSLTAAPTAVNRHSTESSSNIESAWTKCCHIKPDGFSHVRCKAIPRQGALTSSNITRTSAYDARCGSYARVSVIFVRSPPLSGKRTMCTSGINTPAVQE